MAPIKANQIPITITIPLNAYYPIALAAQARGHETIADYLTYVAMTIGKVQTISALPPRENFTQTDLTRIPDLVIEGYSDADIAAHLGITNLTVAKVRRRHHLPANRRYTHTVRKVS